MRVQGCDDSHELRDVLAHDWPVLIRTSLGDVPWLAIPNIGESVKDYLRTMADRRRDSHGR